MSGKQWILIVWLAVSGAVMFVRGIAGTTKTYTEADAIFGLFEVGFLIWLVTQL